jgi:hypothetical protein
MKEYKVEGRVEIFTQKGGWILGDGTHFIALNAKVRKAEGVEVGKSIRVTFKVRGHEKA